MAVGLFGAWAVHDLEEILAAQQWRDRVLPRVRQRHPQVPQVLWRAAAVDTRRMAAAVGLVGIGVSIATISGLRTGGRSPLFHTAVTAFGLHGLAHLASSAAARDYTPGLLTAPVLVLPYAVWARRQLRRGGAWHPTSGRDITLGLLAVGSLVLTAQALARVLVPPQ